MMMNLKLFPALLLVCATTLTGCSRSNVLANLESGSASHAVLIGSGQTAPAGSELPESVAVQVLDEAGRPVASQMVTFVVVAGGGEVYAGASMTDTRGFAREWWTLGSEPGANRLEARSVDGESGRPLVFGTFEATGL